MPISILLADDHVIVRQGIKSLLNEAGYEIVAEASDGHEAFKPSRWAGPTLPCSILACLD